MGSAMAGNSGEGVRERTSLEFIFLPNADKTQGVGKLGELLHEIDDAARESGRAARAPDDFNAALRGFEMESFLGFVLVRASETPDKGEDLVVERRLDVRRSFCEFISDEVVFDFAVLLLRAPKVFSVTFK